MTMQKQISFDRGVPPDEAIPLDLIAESTNSVLKFHAASALQYGLAAGFIPLREYIASGGLGSLRTLNPEQVLVAGGSLVILDLICQYYLSGRESPVVLVDSPTYDRALTTILRHGARVVGVPLGRNGPDLDFLETQAAKGARFYYTQPDFQNPTGYTFSRADRHSVAQIAERYSLPIVEDSPYRQLRYLGKQMPMLFDLASGVVHMSSFSKIIAPGLRVGYAVGTVSMIKELSRLAGNLYLTPPCFNQAIVYEFCRAGYLSAQIQSLKTQYSAKLIHSMAAISEILLLSASCPEGGYYVSLDIPESLSAETVVELAASQGLYLTDGRQFFPNPKDGERFLRLPFCALSLEDITAGIRRLKSVFETCPNVRI